MQIIDPPFSSQIFLCHLYLSHLERRGWIFLQTSQFRASQSWANWLKLIPVCSVTVFPSINYRHLLASFLLSTLACWQLKNSDMSNRSWACKELHTSSSVIFSSLQLQYCWYSSACSLRRWWSCDDVGEICWLNVNAVIILSVVSTCFNWLSNFLWYNWSMTDIWTVYLSLMIILINIDLHTICRSLNASTANFVHVKISLKA